MVSGSRGIRRCKAAVSSTLLSRPREPLPFLYPAWARTLAASATAVASENSSPQLRDDNSALQPQADSKADIENSSTCHLTGTNHGVTSKLDNLDERTRFNESSGESASWGPNHSNSVIQQHRQSTINDGPVSARIRYVNSAIQQHRQRIIDDEPASARIRYINSKPYRRCVSWSPNLSSWVNQQHRQHIVNDESVSARFRRISNIEGCFASKQPAAVGGSQPLVNKTPSGPKVRRIVAYMEKIWERKEYEQQTRNKYFEQMRQERGAENIEPGSLIEDLIKYTPQRTPGSILRISVPESSLGSLLFGADETILEIKHRTGSEIELLEPEDDGKDTRTLILSGPPVCIASAAATIFERVPYALANSEKRTFVPPVYRTPKKTPLQSVPTSSVKPRYYVSYANDAEITAPKRADSVPRPDTWTQKSLEAYIRSLTRITMNNHVHGLLYEPPEEHQELVREILEELFDRDECLRVMTITALNEAFSYLIKKHKIPQVCEIFAKVQLRGFRLNSESFNIMLRGAAKIRDLNTFNSLVGVMVRRGYRPDSGTWVAFLSLLENPNAIFKVVAAMQERGLFYEEGLLPDVCEVLAPHELRHGLNQAKPLLLPDFLAHMTQRYGEGWLNLSGANKLLDDLGGRGLMSECWLMLQYMLSQNIKPDVVSINTVLNHCMRLNDYKTGLELFGRIVAASKVKPNTLTYTILLKSAWQSELYASCRTIWQYACLEGCARFLMRLRIGTSINRAFYDQQTLNPTPTADAPAWKLWRSTAGVFVISEAYKTTPAFLSPRPNVPMMTKWTAMKMARHAVEADLNLYKRWKPAQPFLKLLNESYTADLGFAKRSYQNHKDRMEWLIRHAPAVKKRKRAYEIRLRHSKAPFKVRGYYCRDTFQPQELEKHEVIRRLRIGGLKTKQDQRVDPWTRPVDLDADKRAELLHKLKLRRKRRRQNIGRKRDAQIAAAVANDSARGRPPRVTTPYEERQARRRRLLSIKSRQGWRLPFRKRLRLLEEEYNMYASLASPIKKEENVQKPRKRRKPRKPRALPTAVDVAAATAGKPWYVRFDDGRNRAKASSHDECI